MACAGRFFLRGLESSRQLTTRKVDAMTRSSASHDALWLDQFNARTLAAVSIGGAVVSLWAFGVAESLWRPVLGFLGGSVAGFTTLYLIVRTTRRRPQLRQLYRAVLVYVLAPTLAAVVGGLVVAVLTSGWRP